MKIFLVTTIFLLSACAIPQRSAPRYESESATGISDEAIRQVISNNMNSFNSCYEKSLSLDRTLEGKIVLDWHIVKGGNVEDPKINDAKTEIIDPKMRTCMVQKISTLNFPEPVNIESVPVSFPFYFKDSKQ